MLIGLTRSDKNIQWLCDHAFVTKHALNRVLRYPHKSRIISVWVRTNYDNDLLRYRRSEVISRILDYEPYFEIQQSTILDDFRHLNDLDIKTLSEYSVDKYGYFTTVDFTGDIISEISFTFTIYAAPYGKLRKEINRPDEVSSVLRYVYTEMENIKMKLKIRAIAWSKLKRSPKWKC